MKRTQRAFSGGPVVESLEPRILYSADVGLLAGLATDTTSLHQPQQAASVLQEAANGARHDIVFVDAAVADADQLIADIRAQAAAGRDVEVVRIAADEDGIARITQVLDARQDVAAVHVISHGQDGALRLGNALLDQATLMVRAPEVASWGAAMAQGGDLLLYGCDVAATAVGQDFVRDLAMLAGVDVAASTDLTGNAGWGGDWVLEFQQGRIDAAAALSVQAQASWQGELATQSISFLEGAGYTGTQDATVSSFPLASTLLSDGTSTTMTLVGSTKVGFLRFDNIFGSGSGQIPLGATITSASLILADAGNTIGSPQISMYRMLKTWSESSTWNSMGNGISFDNVEASSTADTTSFDANGRYLFSSTSSLVATVQAWSNGAANHGWALMNNSGSASLVSSEGSIGSRPILSISYTVPAPVLDLDANNSSGVAGTGFANGFTQGGGPVAAADSDASLTAPTANLSQLTVQIANLQNGAAEALAANVTGTAITAAYNSASGLLTLSGTDTAAHYQQVLRTVTYDNTASNPAAVGRTLNFVATGANGGTASASSTLSVVLLNKAPTATITPGSYGATERVALNLHGTGMSIADADAGTGSVTAKLSASAGVFNASAGTSGAVIVGNGTSALTLTGTLTQINNLLAGNSAATLTYTVNSSTPVASDTITLLVNDQGNSGAGGAKTGSASAAVSIAAVNEAPTATMTRSSYSATENIALRLQGTGLSIADVDAGNATVVATVSSLSGVLQAGAGSSGVTIANNGTGAVRLTGTIAQINNLLAGSQGGTLSYTASGENPPTSDTLTLQVNDQGNTGTGGPLTGSVSRAISITQVNDAPTASITQTSYNATERVALALHGTGLSVSDPDAGLTNMTVTLSSGAGVFNALPGSSGVTVAGNNSTSLTLTGTLTQINNLLAGNLAGTVSYTVTSSNPPPADTITLLVNDQGHSGTGGARTGSASAVVNIAAVNDGPGAVVTRSSYTAVTQVSLNLHGTGLSVSDPDSGSAPVRVTLSVGFGTLNAAAGTTGVTVSGSGTDTVVLTGTVAQLNNLLNGALNGTLSYLIGSGTLVSADTLSLQVNDLGNTGSGGAKLASASAGILVVVGNPLVNTPPLANISQGSYQAVENVALNLHGTGLAIDDADAGNSAVTATLSVVSGVLRVSAGTTGVAVVGDGSSVLTLTGTLLQINDLLAGNASASLTYLASGPTPPASDLLTLQVDDQGNTGLGGPMTGLASAIVNIEAVNDAPVATITQGSYNATERVPLALHGTGLSIFDADAGSGQVMAILSSSSGTFHAQAGNLGVAIANNDTAVITLTGTIAQINDLLAGSGGATLSYMVSSQAPPATDLITLLVNDQGSSGDDGAKSGSASVAVAITAINNAPAASIAQGSYSATERVPLSLHGTGLSIADPDAGNALVVARLSSLVGLLHADAGTSGVLISGNDSTSMTLTGTVDRINDLLAGRTSGTLSYAVPGSTPPSSDTLTLAVDDQGSSGTGGALTASASVGVVITAVNEAPMAAIIQSSYQATEQMPLNLHGTGLSVSDADAGSALVTATLSSSAGGVLRADAGTSGVLITGNDGTAITLQGTVDQINDLLAGHLNATLTYTIVSDAPPASDTLTLHIDDEGGSGVGGALTGEASVTVNITAANDAPVVTVTQALYDATEDVALNLHGTGLSIGDADAASSLLSMTLSTVSGTLRADAGSSGVSILNNDSNSLTLIGSVDQINDLLAGQASATLSYLASGPTPPVSDTLTLLVVDQGLSLSVSSTIAVAAVNDAPSVLVPGGGYQVMAGTALALQGTGMSIADPDSGGSAVVATLSSAAGVLAVDVGTSGVSVANNGSTSITLTGSLAQINHLLAGDFGASLIYTADGLNPPASDTITLTVNDQGLGGSGGALTASAGAAVSISPYYAAPTLDHPVADQAATQGQVFNWSVPPYTFSGTGQLSYSAAMSDGTALPAWLQFDPSTHLLSGTPGTPDVGTLSVKITATDSALASVATVFQLRVDAAPVMPDPGTSDPVTPPVVTPIPTPIVASLPAAPAVNQLDQQGTKTSGDQSASTALAAQEATSYAAAAGASVQIKVTGLTSEPAALPDFGQATANSSPGVLGPLASGAGGAGGADSPAIRRITESRPQPAALADQALSAQYARLSTFLSKVADVDQTGQRLGLASRQIEELNEAHKRLLGASAVSLTGLSAGYVIWLLRGGFLLGSMLSTLPAWRWFDPLPVLSDGRNPLNRGGDHAEDEVENIFSKHGEDKVAKEPAAEATDTGKAAMP